MIQQDCDRIVTVLSDFDVISFDIFDTLLLRNVLDPVGVWRKIEDENHADGFAQARIEADRKSYRLGSVRNGETSLDEAYQLMGKKWKAFKEKELAAERAALFANPEIVKVWNKASELGKKRVIVSDMYLPRDFLLEVLNANGISGWDGFYLSSDRQARKTTGALFKVMMEDQKTSPDRVLHIGDNLPSDFRVPTRLGISAIPYVRVRDRVLEEEPFLRKVLALHPSFGKAQIVGALVEGWHTYTQMHPDFTYWNKLGFFLGGVLGYAYVDWVCRECLKRGFNHLMYVGRDGYIWKKISDAIHPEIKTDYFYAPRTMSVRVNGVIGSDEKARRDRERYLNENASAEDAGNARADYTEYLRQFKTDPLKTAIVDGCSSAFSAQRLVEAILGHPIFAFYLLAYKQPDPGMGWFQSDMRTVSFQHISEFMFSSPENPVERVDPHGPVYKTSISPFEQIKVSVCNEIADGALACALSLQKASVHVTPSEWMDYFDVWRLGVGPRDMAELAFARNSTDVDHREYASVFNNYWLEPLPIMKLFGRSVLTLRYSWNKGVLRKTVWLLNRLPVFSYRLRMYKLAEI